MAIGEKNFNFSLHVACCPMSSLQLLRCWVPVGLGGLGVRACSPQINMVSRKQRLSCTRGFYLVHVHCGEQELQNL